MKLQKTILFCLILLGVAACRATSSAPIPMATPTAVPPTNTPEINEVEVLPPAETAVPETDQPIAELPTPYPTITATPTVMPRPTSNVVTGWQTYTSTDYGYTISYPPEASLRTQGVQGYPTDELPEGVTSEAYLDQLIATYPDDICVSIGYGLGSVHILAPLEEGGKYAYICPGLGIGDYDVVDTTETLTIDGRSLTTTFGSQILERDEVGTFRSEIFRFELEDGTQITYIAGPQFSTDFATDYDTSFAEFMADKAILLQIIESYQTNTAVPAQTQSSGHSTQPVISADGSVIAFTSMGALTPGTRPDWSAYAYDASTNQIELLSIRHDGQPVYDPIYAVALSADGRFTAYYAFDGEITPDDPDICTDGDWSEPCEDLYIYDRQTGQIDRIPVGRSSGLGKSYTISLSADGRYVAHDGLQIYDRQTGETINIFAELPNGETFAPVFAANGDIAFVSAASNLVSNDNNETYDVFVWEAATGQIIRVSTASDGGESDDVSGALPFHEGIGESLAISADGRFLTFTSLGTSLTTDELSQCDDYRGFSRACYALYLHDRQTGKTTLVVHGDSDSVQPALSADGRYLTFTSLAQNLLPNSPPCESPYSAICGQIYLLDTQTGALQLISQAASGEWGNSGSGHPRISADGRFITFSSDASNLVPNDTNGVSDIFRYDTATGEMIRVSLVER